MTTVRSMSSEESFPNWMRKVDKRLGWQEREGKAPLVGADDMALGALGVPTRADIPADLPNGLQVYIEDEDAYCTTPCP
jgi:hypothetical protein